MNENTYAFVTEIENLTKTELTKYLRTKKKTGLKLAVRHPRNFANEYVLLASNHRIDNATAINPVDWSEMYHRSNSFASVEWED